MVLNIKARVAAIVVLLTVRTRCDKIKTEEKRTVQILHDESSSSSSSSDDSDIDELP